MKATSLVTVGALCLVAGNARAAFDPNAPVTDGVGVQVGPSEFSTDQAQALRAAGVSVVRTDFASFVIDPNGDGTWDFSIYDAFVTTCAQAGLRVYGILGWGTPYCDSSVWKQDVWRCYGTQDFRNRFDKFVDATVRHFSWRGFTWELWNEPNGDYFWPRQCVGSDPDCVGTIEEAVETAAGQYMDLAMGVNVPYEDYPQGALQIIRDTDPSATIVAPAVSSLVGSVDPTGYLTTCFNKELLSQDEYGNNKVDGLSVHFYRFSNPETVVDPYDPGGSNPNAPNIAGVRYLMDSEAYDGSAIPIVSGEWGYTLQPYSPGITPQVQADYLQRMILTNFSVKLPNSSPGVPLSIWFMDQDRPDVEHDWYFGLFHRYCDTNPYYCATLCYPGDPRGNERDCKTTIHTDPDPHLDTYSDACANVCAANLNECWYDGDLTWCLPHAYYFHYGDPKPAFYAMKTLTQSLTQWSPNATFSRVMSDSADPNARWLVFKAPYDILVAWNADNAVTVNQNTGWGTYLLTGTPLYVAAPLIWAGGYSGNWSDTQWKVDDVQWGWASGFQAQFDGNASLENPVVVNVDGTYTISGIQFNNWVNLVGGKLRFTPGGGNIYVGKDESNNACFDVVTSVLADAVDRNPADPSDNLKYTNTPETFILRKSGVGEVSLVGNNTFHGSVLVGQGYLQLGSDRALGDPHNPLTLAGGGIDFNGYSPTMTSPFAITAAGLRIGNWRSNTFSRYTFSRDPNSNGNINADFTVGASGNLEFSGPLAGPSDHPPYLLTKVGSGDLTLSGDSDNSNLSLNATGGTVYLNKSSAGYPHALASIDNIASGARVRYAGNLQVDASHNINLNGGTLDFNGHLQWGTTMGASDGSQLLNGDTSYASSYSPVGLDINSGNLFVGGAGDLTIDGPISSSGGLKKIGTGALTLNTAGYSNTYSGGTTIDEGMLFFATSGSLPSTGLVTINPGGSLAAAGANPGVSAWIGSGRINTGSSGALLLDIDTSGIDLRAGGYNNLYIGSWGNHSLGGTLTPGANGYRLGGGNGILTVTSRLTNPNPQSPRSLWVDYGRVVLWNMSNYSGGTTINGGTLTFNTTSSLPGTGSITINSGGTLVATGAKSSFMSWLGSNRISTSSTGTLALPAGTYSGSGNAITMGNYSSLSIGAVGSVNLSAPLTPAGNAYRLGGGPGTLTVSTVLSGTERQLITNGNVVLTGTNTYPGATTVNWGSTLTLDDPGSINNTSGILINGALYQNSSTPLNPTIDLENGGTLGGTGSVAADLYVAYGRISPGSMGLGTIGTLLAGGRVTISGGSFLDIDLGSAAGLCDALVMTGTNRTLELGGTLNIHASGNIMPGNYPIITGASNPTGSFTFGDVPAGVVWSLAVVQNGSYYDVVLTAA